ncbi:uncharacterized protein LOC132787664 [Drosophila nasuta]|uniref:uncharacterized protein LOC132787664 n=1 Tax=Drosophila nasuta TaxID=42062 RepID=UPI00295F2CAF|nr:uncharacterized protein LOC132787664 [Drosophila nasuta]
MDDEEAYSTTLLYFYNRMWELWDSIGVHFTTYIERGQNEYFAGFVSLQWLAPQSQDEDEDEEAEEQLDLETYEDEQSTYHWLHMSCIFRASHFSN